MLALLFDEAFGDNCGRHALIDRLFEVVLIQAHPRLRKAMVTMHERPAEERSLESLADLAGVSRSVFAHIFRSVVGATPGAYLQGWRIRLAQQALRQDRPLKTIAIEVGYSSEAALSRAFEAQCGMAPREWRQGREGE